EIMANSGPQYRLVYYDVRALAEPIRWIFSYASPGIMTPGLKKLKKVLCPILVYSFESTVGQIPVLYEKGRKEELSQSHVISRYLAKKFGLVGDNDWDNAREDEVISMVFDLFLFWRTTCFTRIPEQKKIFRGMLDPRVQLYYRKFSEILNEKPGDFILGTKLSHADFWLANLVSMLDRPFVGDHPIMAPGMPQPTEDDIYIGLTAEYPLLKKHMEVVENIPQIKEWIAKRHQTIL
ncbi:Glutathione S-transferase, partial [Pseudolycoriella hygida]